MKNLYAIWPEDMKSDEVLTSTGDADFEVVLKVRDDVDDKRLSEIFERVRSLVRYYRFRKA